MKDEVHSACSDTMLCSASACPGLIFSRRSTASRYGIQNEQGLRIQATTAKFLSTPAVSSRSGRRFTHAVNLREEPMLAVRQ